MTSNIRSTGSFAPFTGAPMTAGLSGYRRSLLEARSLTKAAGSRTVAQALAELFAALEITDGEVEIASGQQQRLRAKLDERLHLVDTFLSGSYRRHTQIRPLDDIDLLVVLDAAHYPFAYQTPRAALDLLETALADAYPTTERKRFDCCIRLQFAGTGIGFDVVPVYQRGTNEFYMPDERTGTWRLTNPKEVQRLVSEKNAALDEWFVPLVKLMKRWRDAQRHADLRGFHLEALLYHALRTVPLTSPDAAALAFEALATMIHSSTPDIWPQGEAVDGELSWARRFDVHAALTAAATTARSAIAADADGRTEEAHAVWRGLFGDLYPEAGGRTAAALNFGRAANTVTHNRPFSATSSGLVAAAGAWASVGSSTSHGGALDEGAARAIVRGGTADVDDDRRAYLEGEIARTRAQFESLQRIEPADAAADPNLWPVRPGTEGTLYAVLVGEQRTNAGGTHRILVKVPREMPGVEPRIYMLRQHVQRAPRGAGRGAVRFTPVRPLRHQWRDGAMCTHAMRDRWDGRLVTSLVHAAGWLFRHDVYQRTGRWIGHEIDRRNRLVVNGTRAARTRPAPAVGARRAP